MAFGAEEKGGVVDFEVGVVDAVPDAVVEGLAEGAHEEHVAGHPAPVVALNHVGPVEVGVLQVDEADGHFVVVAEEFFGAALLGLVGLDADGVEVVAEAAALLLMVAKTPTVKPTGHGVTSRKGDYNAYKLNGKGRLTGGLQPFPRSLLFLKKLRMLRRYYIEE